MKSSLALVHWELQANIADKPDRIAKNAYYISQLLFSFNGIICVIHFNLYLIFY